MKRPTCETCIYCELSNSSELHRCRRLSPNALDAEYGARTTDSWLWCGEGAWFARDLELEDWQRDLMAEEISYFSGVIKRRDPEEYRPISFIEAVYWLNLEPEVTEV